MSTSFERNRTFAVTAARATRSCPVQVITQSLFCQKYNQNYAERPIKPIRYINFLWIIRPPCYFVSEVCTHLVGWAWETCSGKVTSFFCNYNNLIQAIFSTAKHKDPIVRFLRYHTRPKNESWNHKNYNLYRVDFDSPKRCCSLTPEPAIDLIFLELF